MINLNNKICVSKSVHFLPFGAFFKKRKVFSVCLFMCLYVGAFVYVYVCLYMFICVFVYLFICVFVCVCLYLNIKTFGSRETTTPHRQKPHDQKIYLSGSDRVENDSPTVNTPSLRLSLCPRVRDWRRVIIIRAKF